MGSVWIALNDGSVWHKHTHIQREKERVCVCERERVNVCLCASLSQNKSCDKSFEKEIFVRLQNGVRHVRSSFGRFRWRNGFKWKHSTSQLSNVPILEILGSGSGAVGREVAYYTGDQRFESSHQHFYLLKTVFKLYCKEETKQKEVRNGSIKYLTLVMFGLSKALKYFRIKWFLNGPFPFSFLLIFVL